MILDLNLPFLEEALTLFDDQLRRVQAEAATSRDPDGEGFFDRSEYICGLGFTACQTYVVATAGFRGISKAEALLRGPKHRCGEPIVAIVNAAANYWKHHGSWGVAGASPTPRTAELIAALGVDMTEYATTNILSALIEPHPMRFASLLPFLTNWRDALGEVAA